MRCSGAKHWEGRAGGGGVQRSRELKGTLLKGMSGGKVQSVALWEIWGERGVCPCGGSVPTGSSAGVF